MKQFKFPDSTRYFSFHLLPKQDPWLLQAADSTHLGASTNIFGDVPNGPTGRPQTAGFTAGFKPMQADQSGASDGVSPSTTGGNYVLLQGYIAFPAYAKTLSLQMNLKGNEQYATFHLAIASNGKFTRNRADWTTVMRQKGYTGSMNTWTSGAYQVPSCAFGKWVSYALAVSDGLLGWEVELQWSIDGAAFTPVPTSAFSSNQVNPTDATCPDLSPTPCTPYVNLFLCLGASSYSKLFGLRMLDSCVRFTKRSCAITSKRGFVNSRACNRSTSARATFPFPPDILLVLHFSLALFACPSAPLLIRLYMSVSYAPSRSHMRLTPHYWCFYQQGDPSRELRLQRRHLLLRWARYIHGRGDQVRPRLLQQRAHAM